MSTPLFIVARRASEGKLILAVCDKSIHGKKFEDDNTILDLGSKFYNGEENDAKRASELMEKAYIINAAGKEAVKLVVKLGLAAAADVKKIAGIEHVQVLMA